jgi:hypothetical protein
MSSISMRILILDDEREINVINSVLLTFFYDVKSVISETKLMASEDEKSTIYFDTIDYPDINLQVFLCNDIFMATKLLGYHFDIILADASFKRPPLNYEHQNKVPNLGGMLFSLAFVDAPYTFVKVYATEDDSLDENPDYLYLKYLINSQRNSEKQFFSFISFTIGDNIKSIRQQLQQSFYSSNDENNWLQKIFFKLKPSLSSLSELIEILYVGNLPPENSAKITVKDLRKNFSESLEDNKISSEISYGLLFSMIQPRDRRSVISLLLKESCGHALVRYIFGKVAHLSEDEGDVAKLLRLLKSKENHHDRGQEMEGTQTKEMFDFHLNDACKYFDVDQNTFRSEMIAFLEEQPPNLEKARSIFRVNIRFVLAQEESSRIYLYGLWSNENKQSRFRDDLVRLTTNILLDADDPKTTNLNVSSEGRSSEKTITISGNRTDPSGSYLSPQGGSYNDLCVLLNKFVHKIKIVGPCGEVTLSYNGEVEDKDPGVARDILSIQLVLNNLPDNLEPWGGDS